MKVSRKNRAHYAWFFDFDGSLCPHLEVWEERSYDALEILKLLEDLDASSEAGVYWNTGRRPESLASVEARFMNFSGYFIQGSCFWNALTQEKVFLGPSVDESYKFVVMELFKTQTEFRVEHKPTSMRVAPLSLTALHRLSVELAKIPPPDGWHWNMGHRGAELLANGFDKGRALAHAYEFLPSQSIPIAVGDDLLDKPAAQQALARGGYVILVGGACGWITELEHKPDQVIFCETPAQVHSLIRSIL